MLMSKSRLRGNAAASRSARAYTHMFCCIRGVWFMVDWRALVKINGTLPLQSSYAAHAFLQS